MLIKDKTSNLTSLGPQIIYSIQYDVFYLDVSLLWLGNEQLFFTQFVLINL